MKLSFYAFLTAAFFGALLTLTAGTVRGDLDTLRLDLDASRRELRETQGNLDRLRDDSLYRAESLVPRAELEELRSRLDTHDIRALYRDVLAPSVQVSARGGVGGGTLLYSRADHSYVVTAFHVIQKAPIEGQETSALEPCEVRLYSDQGELADEVVADLVAHDEKKDVALLRLRTRRVYPTVAHLPPRSTLRTVRVFTPLYAIGCPLGHDPLPTLGEIASLRKEVGGENFWMMTAPTIFGNSGGGVFHRQTREMLGVSVMICTYDGVVSTPVPHLGILVSMDTIYDWLDSLHYQFIYDPGSSVEAWDRERSESTASGPAGAEDR